MSFSQSVAKAVDTVVEKYISTLATKYNLPQEELIELWAGKEVTSNTPTGDLDPLYLAKALKPELVKLCKERGLSTKGTKPELIAILQGGKVPEKEPSGKQTTPSCKKPTPPGKKNVPEILKQLKVTIPTVPIRKNKFGNMEDPRTSFVFDRKTKKVIGKQLENGTIAELTKEDINMCNREKYEYVLPSNLDRQSKLADEKVEELDDDEEEEIEEEELEEDEIEEEELLEEDDDDEEEEFEEEFEYEE